MRGALAALAGAVLVSGCASTLHLLRLAQGQIELLQAREPIDEIVRDEARDPVLRERLRLVLEAREFASRRLALPDNGSYRAYADLARPYVLWNLFAAPEFSLEPRQWCYPLFGCFAYRGFFDRARAQQAAAELRAEGLNVALAGVPAYSTLGWFDDPVVSPMLRWSDAELVATVFHELAHQKLFVKNDTAFNESFASFVQDQGLSAYAAAYREAHGRTLQGFDPQARQREQAFVALVLDTRERLERLYALRLPVEEMRRRKQAEFAALKQRYEALRDREWEGEGAYDAWFAQPLNNAHLLPFGLYERWQPAFARLFARHGGDWEAFHEAARALAALDAPARAAALQRLLREAQAS